MDLHDVKQRFDADEKFTLVDVREDNEWARGYLPGAIHLGKGVIERDIEKVVLDHGAPLVLYCSGGFRSALAADNLQKMGYATVLSMDGGWCDWLGAGYPTANDQAGAVHQTATRAADRTLPRLSNRHFLASNRLAVQSMALWTSVRYPAYRWAI